LLILALMRSLHFNPSLGCFFGPVALAGSWSQRSWKIVERGEDAQESIKGKTTGMGPLLDVIMALTRNTSTMQLEKDLMLSIPTWEDEYGRPFLVNGVSIFEVLTETINASEAGKENRKVGFR
jgi:hypothetical protein